MNNKLGIKELARLAEVSIGTVPVKIVVKENVDYYANRLHI